MKILAITEAFLEFDNKFLMMHRAKDKKKYPDIWVGVGGKIESNEMPNPILACYREIYEETNIKRDNIEGLKLKYIIILKKMNVLVLRYIFFGKSLQNKFINCNEGKLSWINKKDILNLPLEHHYEPMFKHFFKCNDNNEVFLGKSLKSGEVTFSLLADYIE